MKLKIEELKAKLKEMFLRNKKRRKKVAKLVRTVKQNIKKAKEYKPL